MYSPKIRDDLIPRIYRVAKLSGVAMTQWVNRVIEQALPVKDGGQEINERDSRKEKRRYGQFGT